MQKAEAMKSKPVTSNSGAAVKSTTPGTSAAVKPGTGTATTPAPTAVAGRGAGRATATAGTAARTAPVAAATRAGPPLARGDMAVM